MPAYHEEVLLDSPRAYYRLGETSGTTAVDIVAARNGTHSNVSVNQGGALAGSSDASALYNGSTSITTLPTAVAVPGSAITLEFWAKRTAAPQVNSLFWFAATDRTAQAHVPWVDNNIYWDAGPGDGTYDRINKAVDFDPMQWHHYAFTKDATAGVMNIYVDGLLWHTGSGLTKTLGQPTVAQLGTTGPGGSYFPGYIDEFAVYMAALPAARIQRHFQEGRTSYVGRTATVTYNYGKLQNTFVVPPRVTALVMDLAGARGGGNATGGGLGGRVQLNYATTPGSTLWVEVGESPVGQTGGWGGPGWGTGGAGGTDSDTGQSKHGYGGGGRSSVLTANNNGGHIAIAGAGGGSTFPWQGGWKPAGHGGGTTGGTATSADTTSGCSRLATGGTGGGGGLAGLPMTTGSSADGQAGQPGIGGYGGSINWYGNAPGGGGGGGYWGGGGGNDMYGPSSVGGYYYDGTSGGGGSSWTPASGSITNVVHTQGYRSGHGQVLITFTLPLPYTPAMMT